MSENEKLPLECQAEKSTEPDVKHLGTADKLIEVLLLPEDQ